MSEFDTTEQSISIGSDDILTHIQNMPRFDVESIAMTAKMGISTREISAKFMVPMRVVKYIDIIENKKFSATKDGMGRHSLRKHIVARRLVDHELGWDLTSYEVKRARKQYEAGTHEMCTGRDGIWLILYSIPREEPVSGRDKYFSRTYSQAVS